MPLREPPRDLGEHVALLEERLRRLERQLSSMPANVQSGAVAGVSDHGGLTGLADDDHPQYTTNAEVASLIAAHAAGDVLDGDTAGGVLAGTYPNPTFSVDMATQAELDAHAGAADPHTGYVLESLFDAKGDLLAASADNTPAKLTVGANDTILMADSSQASGLKWVASQTPSTQAFGDAAAEGTADTFARGDHKHGMPTHDATGDPHTQYVLVAGDTMTGALGIGTAPSRLLHVASATASLGRILVEETGTTGFNFPGYMIQNESVFKGGWFYDEPTDRLQLWNTSGAVISYAAGAQQIGVYGVAPASRPAAYTQTYATATRTHANPTATSISTTAATNLAPWGYGSQAQADAIPVAINALIVDVANVKQIVNSMIDDDQSIGWKQ